MSKEKLDASWWWTNAWFGSSAYIEMTLEEQGAYRNLLDRAHQKGGALPTDEAMLAKLCGDPAAWPRVRDVVMRWFVLMDDGWHNEKLDKVYADSVKFKEKNQRQYASRKARGVAGEDKPAPVVPIAKPKPTEAGPKMAYKGQRFIVWTWQHEDFVRALGATPFDLLAWYPKLDAEMVASGAPIVDEAKWLKGRLYQDAKLPMPNLMRGRPELVERSSIPDAGETSKYLASLRASK